MYLINFLLEDYFTYENKIQDVEEIFSFLRKSDLEIYRVCVCTKFLIKHSLKPVKFVKTIGFRFYLFRIAKKLQLFLLKLMLILNRDIIL